MEIIKKLTQAVMEGEEEIAVETAQAILDEKVDLQAVIKELTETMRILGKQFEEFEIFLPEMILAADAMTAAMDIFNPVLVASGTKQQKGTVVLGTAPGDMHEIGKNIVNTVLTADGFNVIDLGKNVPIMEFVNKAKENSAEIIAISALMTTTMPGATDVINLLKDKGIRENHKVIVGGAPTSKEWAEKIGADGWAVSAAEAVVLTNNLVGAK